MQTIHVLAGMPWQAGSATPGLHEVMIAAATLTWGTKALPWRKLKLIMLLAL